MSEKLARFSGNGNIYFCTLKKDFVQTFALSLNAIIPRYGETITLKGIEFQVYNVAYIPHETPNGSFDMQIFVWITPLPIKKDG